MPRKGRIERETPIHLVEDPSPPVKLPPPPAHLSKAMQSWWREVVREYELEPHHLLLLRVACDAHDRLREAQDVLAREGLTLETSTGRKMHPAVLIERDSRTAFMKAIRELDLDMVPVADSSSRPPALRSNRG
jgi:P27 family predicted phage terminase small subunit